MSLRHDRHVMNVHVALEATREFVVNRLFVRLAMAIGTLRDVFVPVLVAGDAGNGPVLAGTVGQFLEHLGMTGTAGV